MAELYMSSMYYMQEEPETMRTQKVEHLFFMADNPQYPITLSERMEVVRTTVNMIYDNSPGVGCDEITFSHYVKEIPWPKEAHS